MTITWWMVVVALFLIPFIYDYFRKDCGWWDFKEDVVVFAIGCWAFALGILIAKIFG